jgi:hypothetical protein
MRRIILFTITLAFLFGCCLYLASPARKCWGVEPVFVHYPVYVMRDSASVQYGPANFFAEAYTHKVSPGHFQIAGRLIDPVDFMILRVMAALLTLVTVYLLMGNIIATVTHNPQFSGGTHEEAV